MLFSTGTLVVAGAILVGALLGTVLRILVLSRLGAKATVHDRWLYDRGSRYAWAAVCPVLVWVLAAENAATETWIGILGAWLFGAALLWGVPPRFKKPSGGR